MKTHSSIPRIFSIAGIIALGTVSAQADKDHKAKVKEERATSPIILVDDQPEYTVRPVPAEEAVTYQKVKMPLTPAQRAQFEANLRRGILKPVKTRTAYVPVPKDRNDEIIDNSSFHWQDAYIFTERD